jgi:hypothetical protein
VAVVAAEAELGAAAPKQPVPPAAPEPELREAPALVEPVRALGASALVE